MGVQDLFGRRLRNLREMQGITQQQLGDKAAISYKYLGAIERGEENPSLKIIQKIANGLGVEMRDMFEFEHEELSQAKLRKKIERLLKNADQDALQQAVKLLRALRI
jgi:transcriptional regulator with XRE-family HTH domain